jgi:hypothetical protein
LTCSWDKILDAVDAYPFEPESRVEFYRAPD